MPPRHGSHCRFVDVRARPWLTSGQGHSDTMVTSDAPKDNLTGMPANRPGRAHAGTCASVLRAILCPDPWTTIHEESGMIACELAFYTGLLFLDQNGPDGNRKAPEEQEEHRVRQQFYAALGKAEKAMHKLQGICSNKKQKTGSTFWTWMPYRWNHIKIYGFPASVGISRT